MEEIVLTDKSTEKLKEEYNTPCKLEHCPCNFACISCFNDKLKDEPITKKILADLALEGVDINVEGKAKVDLKHTMVLRIQKALKFPEATFDD